MQQSSSKAYNQGNMSGAGFRPRTNQGSNGHGHGGNRRSEHRNSPDNNNTNHNNNGGGRNERYCSGSGNRELNGRSHGGGHGSHGGGGGYGGRGATLSREQTRPPPVQSSTQFDSRNHKEIVDFFQHNFDQIVKEQTLNGTGHKPSSNRKAVYYKPPPQATAPTSTVATSESGSY